MKKSLRSKLKKKIDNDDENVCYRRKTFFLTYSQTSLTKKDLEVKWPFPGVGKYQISEMLFALEHHNDGNLHWHVYINFKKRVTVSNMSFFDCFSIGSQKMEHPNIKKVWFTDGLLKYMNKERYKVYEYGMSLEAKKFARKKHVKYSKNLLKFVHDELNLYELIEAEPHLLLSAKKLIEGKNLFKSSKDSVLVRYRNNVNKSKKRHYWIFGDTNSGKTYYKENVLKKQHPNDWFDIPYNNDYFGYNGERFLFADEYDGQLTIWQLNLLCDGGAKVNVKGSSSIIYEYPIVYIFSNHSIKEVYQKVTEKDPALVNTLFSRFRELYMVDYDIYDISDGYSMEHRRLVYDHLRDYDYDMAKNVFDNHLPLDRLNNARDTYYYNEMVKLRNQQNIEKANEIDKDINQIEDEVNDDNDDWGSQAMEDNEFDELSEDEY